MSRRALNLVKKRNNTSHEGGALVAFVHVPKTAGGTVKAMLTAPPSQRRVIDCGNFLRSPEGMNRKLAQLTARGWSKDDVVIGHVPYGAYRAQFPPDVTYMTFLREPVDRVISHYYRHVDRAQGRDRTRGVKPRTRKRGGSLETVLSDPKFFYLSNLQTRFLCSDPAPMGRLEESALEEAKTNLRELAFVGIQERFTESLVLFQRSVGLELTPATDRHVNTYRPSIEDIDDAERQLIEEHNRLDAELYRSARALFDERVAEADEAFAAEVDVLRAATTTVNDRDNAEVDAVAEWIEGELPPGRTKLDDALRATAAERGIPDRVLKRAARRVAANRRRPDAA
jgi:hypothetical protein